MAVCLLQDDQSKWNVSLTKRSRKSMFGGQSKFCCLLSFELLHWRYEETSIRLETYAWNLLERPYKKKRRRAVLIDAVPWFIHRTEWRLQLWSLSGEDVTWNVVRVIIKHHICFDYGDWNVHIVFHHIDSSDCSIMLRQSSKECQRCAHLMCANM